MKQFDTSQNIRSLAGIDDDELRASMQKSGWIELFPGYADENSCLIVGHRRMKIAQELGIKPVIKTITFGDGSDGAAKRLEAAIASNIGMATLTKKDRQRIAELAYQHGYTQAQIAQLLGVGQKTVSRDLEGLVTVTKPSRPKGGRPKSTKKKDTVVTPKQQKSQLPPPIKAVDAKNRVAGVDIKVDPVTWQAFNEIVQQEHKSATSKIGELVTSYVDGGEVRAELPKTSQEKVDVAIRQHQRKLDAAFESRVAEGVRKRIDEIVLPHWKQKLDDAERILNRRNGIMDKATFNAVRRGLHPDSRNAISTEKLAEAFDAFMRLEKLLLNEKDSPSDPSNIPSSLAEWDKMRVKRAKPAPHPSNVARRQ
jgi:ParB-like chromosome segregation protein Spo0J